MSFPALAWASQSKVSRSADKLVLLGLADRHNTEHDLAYPSLAWICEFSSLDRKTVVTALDRLERDGFIQDSGHRVGKTKQVKAYRLNLNSTENGLVKTEPFPPKGTDFPAKGSQKRNTEPFTEPTEAKASLMRVFNHWNKVAARYGLRSAEVLNNSRKQMGLARLREQGEANLIRAIDACGASPLCRGEVGDGRKADIMMILQPRTLARLLEGYYGSDEVKRPVDPAKARESQLRTAEMYERMGRTNEAAEIRASLDRSADPKMAAAVVRLVRGGLAA